MVFKKGFTLMEIMVVLVIVGILAAVAIPNFVNSMEQSKVQSAQNNLLAISTAQSKYAEDHNGIYCVSDGVPPCNLSALSLGMGADTFTYLCNANGTPTYICTAISADGITVTLNGNNPILIGTNPSCAGGPNNSYCPS